ncbi:uncharacterized protein ACBT57_021030 isoform 1-T1 [Dama dama]
METLGQGQDDSQEWLLLGAAEKQEVWEESPSSLACSGFSSWVLSCLERILGNAKDILPSAWEWSQRPRMEEHKMPCSCGLKILGLSGSPVCVCRAHLPAQFPLVERTSDPHLETSWTLLGLSSQWLAVMGETHFYFDGVEGVRPGNQTGHKSQLHHSPTV